MTSSPAIEQLNSTQYLYLRELSEPRDNALKLVVEQAVVNRSGLVESKLPELDKILKDASPIESVEGCKVFVSHRSLTFGLPPLGLQAAE